MSNIRFIQDFNQISLGQEWVDVPSFKSKNCFINEKGQKVGSDYTGKLFTVVSKKEKPYSILERIGRIFLGCLSIVCTFGFSYKSKCIAKLISKKAKTIRFAEGFAQIGTLSKDKVHIPLGLTNYGQSCWFACALQMLLSSSYFEQIVHSSQAKQGSQVILKALLELIEYRKEGNIQKQSKALQTLHEAMCKKYSSLYKPGYASDALFALSSFCHALGPDRIVQIHEDHNFFKNVSLGQYENPLKKIEKKGKPLPDLIYLRHNSFSPPKIDLNQMIDLSKDLKNGEIARYRIVSTSKNMHGHAAAFVRVQNLWYLCDDEQITRVSIQVVNSDHFNDFLLERIKNSN